MNTCKLTDTAEMDFTVGLISSYCRISLSINKSATLAWHRICCMARRLCQTGVSGTTWCQSGTTTN